MRKPASTDWRRSSSKGSALCRRPSALIIIFCANIPIRPEEGLALMVLAEALLRVPDDATADRLIADKLAQPAWATHATSSEAVLVQASVWALGLTARHFAKSDFDNGDTGWPRRRFGATDRHGHGSPCGPPGHADFRRAFHPRPHDRRRPAPRAEQDRSGANYSFDMLGEGARTASDAEAYFASYAHAIEILGTRAAHLPGPTRHFHKAFGSASAFRGDLPWPCHARTRAAAQPAHRSGPRDKYYRHH